jgi:hypothetical protein
MFEIKFVLARHLNQSINDMDYIDFAEIKFMNDELNKMLSKGK